MAASSTKTLAEPEVLARKPKPMVGLFATLSEEQKARALAYRGAESFGPSEFLRNRG